MCKPDTVAACLNLLLLKVRISRVFPIAVGYSDLLFLNSCADILYLELV